VCAGVYLGVSRVEQQRTDAQVHTIREALLGEDPVQQNTLTGPDRGGFLGSKKNGAWGMIWAYRDGEDVLDRLRTGASSATVDDPFCLTPEDREPRDLVRTEAGVDPWLYACDLTRGGRPFGWVVVTPGRPDAEGRPWSITEYGIGPDAGFRGLEARASGDRG
jgi:hypothetical protein